MTINIVDMEQKDKGVWLLQQHDESETNKSISVLTNPLQVLG